MVSGGGKRLAKELEKLTKTPPDGIIVEAKDMSKWTISLIGPKESPYEGGTF